MGLFETGAGRARGFARSFYTLVFCAAALVAADGIFGQARSENRTLSFKQLHTGETLEITYKRNGRYDSAALKKINYILRDWRRNEATTMDPKLLDLVWEVRKTVGASAPIHVLSGYRSPVTNAMLRSRSRGVAKFSQHMAGKALDFYIPGVSLSKLRQTGLKFQVGGVGYYPTSGSPFVHLDTGSVRHWPRMTRSQLAKVFPKGRTLHIPSDGKPMPGAKFAAAGMKSSGNTQVASRSGGTRQQAVFSNPRLDPSVPVRSVSTGSGGNSGNLISAMFESGDEDKPAAKPAKVTKPTVVASLGTAASKAPAPIPRLKPTGAITLTTASSASPDTQTAPEATTAIAAADTPLPSPRPILVASLEPAAEAIDQPAMTALVVASSASVLDEKPLITASIPRIPAQTVLPRDRPLVSALDTIAALIASNNPNATATLASASTGTAPVGAASIGSPIQGSTATALASTATVPDMPPFAATFTGQQVPLRDGPALVAIDYRRDALKAYLDSGTCLRAPTFIALRHPDQKDIGALTGISGPVVVNEFTQGPQLIYPMRRFTGQAVSPVATRSYQIASAKPAPVRTTETVLRATTLR